MAVQAFIDTLSRKCFCYVMLRPERVLFFFIFFPFSFDMNLKSFILLGSFYKIAIVTQSITYLEQLLEQSLDSICPTRASMLACIIGQLRKLVS